MLYIKHGVIQSDGHGSTDPESLQAPHRRYCPNMRSCWDIEGIMASLYIGPGIDDKTIVTRRICAWLILGVGVINNIFSIFRNLSDPAAFIIIVIFTVIEFFVVASALHRVDRRCLDGGAVKCFWLWETSHFNIALLIMAILHIGFFIGSFTGLSVSGSSSTGLLLWILVIAIGWIASWDPEPVNVI